MSKELVPQNNEIIIYTTPGGAIRVEVTYQESTFWLTQKQIAGLFGVDVRTINEHLKHVFATGELQEEPVIRKFRITAADGKQYMTNFYNLDAIIAVGYRVNSHQATQFRIWATATLREFITKGFVLDDERLKLNKRFGRDYFDELLERIVSMYLDYAENQASRQIPMKMEDWKKKLDTFLKFNEYEILTDAGKVSHEIAVKLAGEEYDIFRVIQDREYESDFDKDIKKITSKHYRGKNKA